MNLDKVNKKKQDRKDKNLATVKSIITKHHTRNVKKIQGFLVEEYKIAVSEKTIKRYLTRIKRETQLEIAKKVKIAKGEQKKKESEKTTYPYLIKDPSGKEHRITGDNMTITIGWGESGRLITYDTKDKIWRYDNNGRPFDKNKKERRIPRTSSIGFFNFGR